MTTPTIDRFLSEIAGILQNKNGSQLQDYLLIEPPFPDLYNVIISELRQTFPGGSKHALEQKCTSLLPEREDSPDVGGAWPSFITFMVEYLEYLRNLNVQNLVLTHEMLSRLVTQCISALSNASMGIVVLPTVIAFSRTLVRLSIGLERRPDLTENMVRRKSAALAADEDGERLSLAESTADLIRRAFTICLTERSSSPSGVTKEGRPEGKKIGIYSTANLSLKLAFHCQKTRSAQQVFTNIYNQSPPLSLYPASQRVTYLYYLGRFMFSNNHFYRAQLALQAAFDQCHSQCLKQRGLILIYLIGSNIIQGRFPSSSLLQRPEADGLGDRFLPVCAAIRKGDLEALFSFLNSGPHTDWFLTRGILLPLRIRGEVLVWRSLARRTFLINGTMGDSNSRKAPTFELSDLLILGQHFESSYRNKVAMSGRRDLQSYTGREVATDYVDPDLEGVEDAEQTPVGPTMEEIEAILSSLIYQGFVHGYIAHKLHRFAILGAKFKGPVNAGFPNVWDAVKGKFDDEVPGWVKDNKSGGLASKRFGGGMVVHLSGARPVGTATG